MSLLQYKPAYLVILGLLLCLFLSAHAVAAEFSANCRVGNGRSSITVRNTGARGKFFVQLFSGEESQTSLDKTANNKKVVEFKFDSDKDYLAANPDAVEIDPAFIKKRDIAVILRKAESNANMAGTRAKCKSWRAPRAAVP